MCRVLHTNFVWIENSDVREVGARYARNIGRDFVQRDVQNNRTFFAKVATNFVCAVVCCWSMTAHAVPTSDLIGDFGTLSLRPNAGSLDVVSAEVTLLGESRFVFSATMDDDIGNGPAGSVYILGLNRGKGLPLLFADGSGGLFLDIVDATGAVNPRAPTLFGPTNVQIAGDTRAVYWRR
jgi:hypothetical protein